MRFILIFIIFILQAFTISAQQGTVGTRIEKILDGNLTWIKLTLINKGNDPIIISDMCRLTEFGNEIGRSTSFATAMAYDESGSSIGNSNRLYFISFDKNSGTYLRREESEVQVFLLKNETIPGFFNKNVSEKDIKNLQLKIHLTYKIFVPNGIVTYTEEVVTNQIRF
ncbi:MAG: hypothetical protein QM751_00875 [Paludibacteraceae bacterium]